MRSSVIRDPKDIPGELLVIISLPCLLRSRCAGDLSYILRLTTAASLILLVSVSHHAEMCAAAAIIDQQQLQTSAGWGFGFGLNLGEQEVVAGVAGKLEGFDFWLNDTANLSSVLIDVSVKLGAVGSGTLVFQDTISYASEDLGRFFFVDTSAADVVLTPGNRFVLGVFPRAGLTLGGQTGNPYGAGGFFFNSLGGSDYDMAFRTHVSVVPESSAFAIALAGLACGGFSMWRRRKDQRVGRSFIMAASLALVAACLANGPLLAAPISIDMVTVGNPGNANDPATGNLYGAVNYEYQIGKYAVTIGQYTAFLNAVAATDTYALYNTNMGTNLNMAGISRTGSSGSYTYGVINNGGDSSNRPITYVSWWDAARFSNWMANGQPTGAQSSTTTENGAYNVNGAIFGNSVTKNATNPNTGLTPAFYIPLENEWYKAAYYSPTLNSGSGGYYAYATQNNTTPGNVIGSGANQANYIAGGVYSVTQSGSYSSSQNYLTDVGAFTNSASFYGTFDQSGNVFQWNNLDGTPSAVAGQRGGYWGYDGAVYTSSFRATGSVMDEGPYNGFRLASPVPVPEPSTWVMGLAGIACGGWGAWRRWKRTGGTRAAVMAASLALVAACLCTAPAHAVTIEWSTVVSSTGNAADPLTGLGSVDREYRIGKYEVTIQQYTDFLNAVAADDPYSLYNTNMGTNLNIAGISRNGTSGGYSYSVINNGGPSGNRPITYVSWFNAARFANWMQNGQGSGSTETGAYTLSGATFGWAPAKNPGATFYIPTENEWYKAAYFSPVLNSGSGGYHTYATQSNTDPGNAIGSGANQANYYPGDFSVTQSDSYSGSQNYLTDVGAFTNSASYYGTFDQSGSVFEWNDLNGDAGSVRGLRGGSWANYASTLSSSGRGTGGSQSESFDFGFRLASPVAVPEPSTWVMGLAGMACGGFSMWRRRKRA